MSMNYRLCGSYEAMDGGWTEDGLVDFTGGIGHRIDLTKKKELPADFFDLLMRQDKMNNLMGCSITVSETHPLSNILYDLLLEGRGSQYFLRTWSPHNLNAALNRGLYQPNNIDD